MSPPYGDLLTALAAHPKTWLVTGVAGFIGSKANEFAPRLQVVPSRARHNQPSAGVVLPIVGTTYEPDRCRNRQRQRQQAWQGILSFNGYPSSAWKRTNYYHLRDGRIPSAARADQASRRLPLDTPAAAVLLKIDVQGFELEVLKGVTGLLPQIDALYVEASYVELYEGQALHEEIERFLIDAGFTLDGRFNTRVHQGEPVQADLLFRRARTASGGVAPP